MTKPGRLLVESALADGGGDGVGGSGPALLDIQDLFVSFESAERTVRAVNGVDMQVFPGEVFAVVGESGSGKSVSMLSVMGLLDSPHARIRGSIRFGGLELTGLSRNRMNAVRGSEIGMVFQDPMSSLNPVHPIGRQISESLRLHRGLSRGEAKIRAVRLLDRVGIPDAANRWSDYPHEFSGGMRQRVMIAIALACDPKLLIADEPTTALDVTVQRQIVRLVKELQEESGMAVVWITHDLGVVAEIADRIAVMYAGRIMEQGASSDLYESTKHPYTAGLLRSIPRLDLPLVERLPEIPGAPPQIVAELSGCPFHDRCPLSDPECLPHLPELEPTAGGTLSACVHHRDIGSPGSIWPVGHVEMQQSSLASNDVVVEVRNLKVHFPVHHGGFARRREVVHAVDGIDLDILRGRTLGVVGESGSGKSTLGRALVGLERPTEGTIKIDGQPLDMRSGPHRRRIQMVFQDPFSSMNPGLTIKDIVSEPMRIHKTGTAEERLAKATALLEQVGLRPDVMGRHPHEFSGGQRQRIAIARALASSPDVVVCDEPVSSLDVSVQAQIINLLTDIQSEQGLALVFIAHDLSVVRHISQEMAVMYLGEIVERAPRSDLYNEPLHPYTKALLAAVPVPNPSMDPAKIAPALEGDLPSSIHPPAGCRFHTRCPVAVAGLCDVVVPSFREVDTNRWVACHLVDVRNQAADSDQGSTQRDDGGTGITSTTIEDPSSED